MNVVARAQLSEIFGWEVITISWETLVKHLFVGACVIGLLGLGGFAKQVFLLGKINGNQPELEERHDFFVSGLGQTKTIGAVRECEHAENVAQLEVERPTLDSFLGFFSSGIYAPATTCIYFNAKWKFPVILD